MSKHRHRESRGINSSIDCRNNRTENNQPFGINIQQLLNMLGGNVDINGITSILSLMNRNGFDLNSISNQFGSQRSNSNFSSKARQPEDIKDAKEDIENIDVENTDIENIDVEKEKIENIDKENTIEVEEDENIIFLKKIREIVNLDKKIFINKIIEMYQSEVIKNK